MTKYQVTCVTHFEIDVPDWAKPIDIVNAHGFSADIDYGTVEKLHVDWRVE